MTGALANRGRPSLSSRPEALDCWPLVGVRLANEEGVLDQLVVVLGVGHSRLQQLAPVAGHLTRGKGEDSACLVYGLAPQVSTHHARLARGGAYIASLCAHHLASRSRRDGCRLATGGSCRLLRLRSNRL